MVDPESDNREFVTIAKVGAIAEGGGASFRVGDRPVAVFFQRGRYLAIDDLCPHMGGSLAAGSLDEGGVVTCLRHGWRFHVPSGRWCDNPRLSIDTFEVRIMGDEIQVRPRPKG